MAPIHTIRVPLAILASILSLILVGLEPASALAANVSTSDSTASIVLPSDGSVYQILSGGTFDQLDVNNGTMTFTMSAGESVEIVSNNNRALTNDQNLVYSCGSSSSLVISASGSLVVNVTPSTGCSTGSGGGGGGGYVTSGASAGSVTTSATTTTTTATTTATSTISVVPPTVPTTSMPQASTGAAAHTSVGAPIVRTLTLGESGNDIAVLQKLLAQYKSVYPSGRITGYYGLLTKQAVMRFQKKYKLAPTGMVGPATRAILNKMVSGS